MPDRNHQRPDLEGTTAPTWKRLPPGWIRTNNPPVNSAATVRGTNGSSIEGCDGKDPELRVTLRTMLMVINVSQKHDAGLTTKVFTELVLQSTRRH